MTRVPQQLAPGILRRGTPEAGPNRWWDANGVRFRQGLLQPIGGNILYPGSIVDSAPRDILTWTDNNTQHWAAVGTDTAIYTFNFETQELYDITPSGVGPLNPPAASNDGYGYGLYDRGLYGQPPRIFSGNVVLPPPVSPNFGDRWSMDTFGENLMFVPTQDGRLFEWRPSAPTAGATVVAGAPTGNLGVLVSDQRSVVLLGAGGDPRTIAWSDQENPNTWVPDISNLAGSKQLVTQSRAMSGIKTPFGILIFTDAGNDIHLMSYVGAPYAYGIQQVGAGCSPISPRAAVNVGSFAAWPGVQNFWFFNGNVQALPCDVADWFFSLVNRTYVGRLFGSPVAGFSEIWWDWPDEGSSECNRYVVVNFAEPTVIMQIQRPWTIGMRSRTAAAPTSALQNPVLGGLAPGSNQGALYLHEYGWLDNGNPRASNGLIYAETGSIINGQTDERFNVRQVAFDVTPPTFLGYEFFMREQADGPETSTGVYNVTRTDGLLDIRFSARHARMRVTASQDLPWALGVPRLEMSPGGKR